jgi:hypothetical protein
MGSLFNLPFHKGLEGRFVHGTILEWRNKSGEGSLKHSQN